MRHLSWRILIAKRTAIIPVIGEIGYVTISFFWLEVLGALREIDETDCVSFPAGHFARFDLSEPRDIALSYRRQPPTKKLMLCERDHVKEDIADRYGRNGEGT